MDPERWSHLPVISTFLEQLWRWGVAFDQRRFRQRVTQGEWPRRLPVPVVSVGNLTVGGTGKTPTVEALSRWWLRRGGKPGLLSRGYKSRPGEQNDEYQLLARRLPGVPHIQDPDRYQGGRELLAAHPEVDLILLDDGFQHRRLHRDVDLVVIDCSRPFTGGYCLPKGLLREPWPGLGRADGFLLTRAEGASPHKLVILEHFLGEHFPTTPRYLMRADYDGVRGMQGTRQELPRVPCVAFAGIGNPSAFFRGLRALDLEVLATRAFPDHHHYTDNDLQSLSSWAREQGAGALLCTEKDGVKLEALDRFPTLEIPLLQLRLQYDILGGDPLAPLAGKKWIRK